MASSSSSLTSNKNNNNNGITWSPFFCLPQAALTPSGLLQLDVEDHEVELIRRGPMELRFEGLEPMGPCPKEAVLSSSSSSPTWQDKTIGLTLTVTTHRLVWFWSTSTTTTTTTNNNNKRIMARFVHLSNVHQVQATGGASLTSWNASYKLIISTYTYGDLILAFRSSSDNHNNTGPKNDRDDIHQQITKALERRLWEQATRLQEKQVAVQSLTKRKVGVDHILTKNKLKHQQAKKVAEDALSGDAEQLLQEAGELLQVIQKYVAMLQKHQQQKGKNDNNNDNNDSDDGDAEKLSTLLQDMGMTSALTKSQIQSSSGNKEYLELIARQVCDFLLPKLPSMGGIMTLTDVFCLFNRARGTNLISPEDLFQACQLLNDLQLGISQRTFAKSGIVVVQLDSMFANNNKDIRQRLTNLCPTTALEASHVLKMSPLLTLEQLEDAERQGYLCRDVTLETTRFYPNKFLEW